jgi:myosin-5
MATALPSPRTVGGWDRGSATEQSYVWVPDAQKAWRVGRVVEWVGADSVRVILPDTPEPILFPREKTKVWDVSHSLYLEDAAKLNNLHEGALLNLLKSRFDNDDIYTMCGDVLVSVNPYKTIPLLYQIPEGSGTALRNRMQSIANTPCNLRRRSVQDFGGDSSDSDEGEDGDSMTTDTVLDHPHVYTIADKAHRLMTDPANWVRASGDARPRDQSIIISGESGAGKTEAAKYVMRYLISASQVISGKEEGSFGAVMERCLLQSTVVLEAFGNAKTVRNDNSSRFGKYIKLQYDPSWEVVGARTMHFLLEKSRVVGQDKGERGYHVFYQLCQGLEGPARTELHLAPAEKFDILNAGGVFTQSEEVDDKEQFRSLEKALEVLGIDKGRQGSLWRLLAALLHMGNIVFNQRTDQEIEASGKTHKVELDSPLISVHDLAAMIGLPAGVLVDSIRTRTSLTGRGSWFNVPLNSEQAKDSLQGLIKHIYGQLFSWLVGKVNESHVNETRQVHGGRHGVAAFIGILDIFGFEIMHVNSFEQLCINYANEVLQQQFNHHVFIVEQEMYASEGVDWTTINFRDNQPVIDLISKKPNGLLIQMEELGLLGRKADNRALLQLYHNTHLVSCEYYAKPRFEGPEFIIKHFAGDVTYNVVGFLEKNNDSLHDSLLDLIDSTSFDFLKELCSYYDQEPLLDPLNAAGSQSFTAMPSVGPEDAVLTSGLPPPPGPGYRRMSTGGGTAAGMRRIGSRMENKVARQEAQGTQGKVHQVRELYSAVLQPLVIWD